MTQEVRHVVRDAVGADLRVGQVLDPNHGYFFQAELSAAKSRPRPANAEFEPSTRIPQCWPRSARPAIRRASTRSMRREPDRQGRWFRVSWDETKTHDPKCRMRFFKKSKANCNIPERLASAPG